MSENTEFSEVNAVDGLGTFSEVIESKVRLHYTDNGPGNTEE